MSEYRSFINDFDPRRPAEENSAGGRGDGEYIPRPARRGMNSDGEYRPRRPRISETTESSPSPVKEGGDDDFVLFSFEEARRRKQEREDRLNEQLAREEAPRRVVDRIAAEAPPRCRAPRRQDAPADQGARKASGFVGKLAGYAQPLTDMMTARGRSESGTSRSRTPASGHSSRNTAHGAAHGTAHGASGGNGGKDGRGAKSKAAQLFSSLPSVGKCAVVLVGILLALVTIYYSVFGILLAGMERLDLDRRSSAPASEVSAVELMSKASVTNILLLGIDDDGSSGSRSDTIMIASLDRRSDTIRLCSILRDCYVEIPGHKNNRINSAYAKGGVQLAVQTVESNFRVKIDHCVTIDMAALVDVVDAVGGVEIELTEAEAKQVNLHSHCGLTTSSGKQLLNGKQAVTYAQIRKIDSDFKRTQRQRTLINAIIAKVRTLGVGELLGLVDAVAPSIATDMSSADIASLALKALPALSNEMGQMTIPADGKYSSVTINGMSVLDLELEANAKLLQSYIFGD